MKIKIKKWEDLDGIKNEKYEIKIFTFVNPQPVEIQIKKQGGYILISVIETFYPTPNEIVKFLKAFGFDVEFEQPRKLTWREWCFCNAYPGHWALRDRNNNFIYFCSQKPYRKDGVWRGNGTEFNHGMPKELFTWLTWEAEPISTSEMIRWEHEPEPNKQEERR